MHWVAGSLTVLMGVIAIGIGLVMADRVLQSGRRVYRRTAALSAATLGGWGSWFLGGFSGLSMGFRWLTAVGALVVWSAAGLGLVGVGIQLFDRL
jgi:hypothetical protein